MNRIFRIHSTNYPILAVWAALALASFISGDAKSAAASSEYDAFLCEGNLGKETENAVEQQFILVEINGDHMDCRQIAKPRTLELNADSWVSGGRLWNCRMTHEGGVLESFQLATGELETVLRNWERGIRDKNDFVFVSKEEGAHLLRARNLRTGEIRSIATLPSLEMDMLTDPLPSPNGEKYAILAFETRINGDSNQLLRFSGDTECSPLDTSRYWSGWRSCQQ